MTQATTANSYNSRRPRFVVFSLSLWVCNSASQRGLSWKDLKDPLDPAPLPWAGALSARPVGSNPNQALANIQGHLFLCFTRSDFHAHIHRWLQSHADHCWVGHNYLHNPAEVVFWMALTAPKAPGTSRSLSSFCFPFQDQ